MDDAIGGRFALIATSEVLASLTPAQHHQNDALDAQILPAEANGFIGYLIEIGRQALLVRPDRYLANSATSAAEVPAMLAAAAVAFMVPQIEPGGLATERRMMHSVR